MSNSFVPSARTLTFEHGDAACEGEGRHAGGVGQALAEHTLEALRGPRREVRFETSELMGSFPCPTRIVEQLPFDQAVAAAVDGRRWALVTSSGWCARGAAALLAAQCGEPAATFHDVKANPTVSSVLSWGARLPHVPVVVALGGGSVIDAAKAMVALQMVRRDETLFMAHLRAGAPLPAGDAPQAIVAVPTTSGTGSEVTPWGTLWGPSAKYSVSDRRLYPSHAILDPTLCASMPWELTLSTGLDALSHALESVWNRRRKPMIDAVATAVVAALRRDLGAVLADSPSLQLRRHIQTAALLAGLVMGTTQTALAHSISYPFTLRHGLPHGLACSFSLAEVARYNAVTHPECLTPIAMGLGCAAEEVPEALESWFEALGVPAALARYVTPDAVDALGDTLITPARAANNLRAADGPAASRIARRALERLRAGGALAPAQPPRGDS